MTLYYKVRRDSFFLCFIFPARTLSINFCSFAPRYYNNYQKCRAKLLNSQLCI
nr:MAG TPA: hypothetical protein [Bacteriophage sp.]